MGTHNVHKKCMEKWGWDRAPGRCSRQKIIEKNYNSGFCARGWGVRNPSFIYGADHYFGSLLNGKREDESFSLPEIVSVLTFQGLTGNDYLHRYLNSVCIIYMLVFFSSLFSFTVVTHFTPLKWNNMWSLLKFIVMSLVLIVLCYCVMLIYNYRYGAWSLVLIFHYQNTL